VSLLTFPICYFLLFSLLPYLSLTSQNIDPLRFQAGGRVANCPLFPGTSRISGSVSHVPGYTFLGLKRSRIFRYSEECLIFSSILNTTELKTLKNQEAKHRNVQWHFWVASQSSGASPPPSPIFGPFLLWPNGCMHQNATWYRARPRPRRLCVRWGPRSPLPQRGTDPQFSAYICCGQMAAWIKI